MKKNHSQKITMIVLALGGGVAGFLGAQVGMEAAKTISTPAFITLLVLFIPAFFLVIALHEGGHALAGTYVKFDFKLYAVGPFLWEKEMNGWKFKWNKNVNTSGGMVICVPIGSEELSKRFAFYVAGGPLSSLVGAGMFYLIALVLPTPNNTFLEITTGLVWILATLSAVIFIMTALPFHAGGFSSDGARVLRLFRGGDVARFEVLLVKIIASSMGGVRPSLLNQDELNEAMALSKKINAPMGVYLNSFFFQAAWDRHQLDEAEAHLTNYLNESVAIPEGIRSTVYLDAVFFYAYGKSDLAKAQQFWKQYKPSALIPRAMTYGAEAALELLQKDNKNALVQIEKAIAELPNMMDKGSAHALKERLLSMRAQAETMA